MILGVKNTDVEAHRYKDDAIKGMSMNIDLREVTVNKKDIEVKFSYTIIYDKEVGMMRVDGVIYAQEDLKKAKEISDAWKQQKLPPEFAEAIINTINYSSGTEGTFIARPLNLAPPLVPPKVEVTKAKGKKR